MRKLFLPYLAIEHTEYYDWYDFERDLPGPLVVSIPGIVGLPVGVCLVVHVVRSVAFDAYRVPGTRICNHFLDIGQQY